MKKVVLGMMAVAISIASIAQDQDGRQKGQRNGEQKEFRHKGGRAFKDMNFSDAQKAEMKTVNENFHNQMKSLNENKSLSQEALKEKRESLMNERKTQISALLTPEQKKQWEEKMKEHSFKGKDGKKFDRRNKDRKQNV